MTTITPKMKQRIILMTKKGYSQRYIARHLDCSRSAVWYHQKIKVSDHEAKKADPAIH